METEEEWNGEGVGVGGRWGEEMGGQEEGESVIGV